ncbi:MAG: protein-glutamate methylesterase/protein-glutamine glutaminase [Spirochaetota bacterium]
MSDAVRVLVVDDSALARQIITGAISRHPKIDVVGTAPDVYVARDRIVALKPDVLTLDVEMPRMDGVQFLKRLMPQYPMPVIIVSALTRAGAAITLDALASGAVDFVPKPSSSFGQKLDSMADELVEKILVAAQTDVSRWRDQSFQLAAVKHKQTSLQESSAKVIAVGASTGGTVALTGVIRSLPTTVPGMVVVQHMPPVFTGMFADKLNEISAVEVKEAADGDRVLTGRVLIAPGGVHTTVERQGGRYVVRCKAGEPVSGHCPSVDVLMESVATAVGRNAVGVVLTGMGSDGANGLLRMRQAGARTFAQDEASSVVFGMPKQAYQNGAAEKLVAITKVADELVRVSEEITA